MSKRKKSKSVHVSVRMPEEIAHAVVTLAKATGWSDSKSLMWLASIGDRLLRETDLNQEMVLREFEAHQHKHTVEQRAEQMKREATAAVRSVLAGEHVKRRRKAATPLKDALTAKKEVAAT